MEPIKDDEEPNFHDDEPYIESFPTDKKNLDILIEKLKEKYNGRKCNSHT